MGWIIIGILLILAGVRTIEITTCADQATGGIRTIEITTYVGRSIGET